MSRNKLELIEEYQRLSRNKECQQLLLNPLLLKDVWHTLDDLNLKINEHDKHLTLNFCAFSQDWLKLLVQLYILIKAKPNGYASTIYVSLAYLKCFSKFLDEQSIYSPSQINYTVFEAFDYYLHTDGRKPGTISCQYKCLAHFFDTCRLEGWLDVNTYWFKGKRKRYYPKNDEIVYLPEEIWNQLDENLQYLPEPLQRMVVLIRTTGLRIGEVCNIPLDCLRQRSEQWRIRFTTEKYDVEDELPIVLPELVAVIKEQQEYIRQQFGEKFNKLFCANNRKACGRDAQGRWRFFPAPKVMASHSFNDWLNKLAKEYNIRTKEGEIWHFQSHQFRRTVATVMANAGVRDLIIQKYLRHRSPDMQRYYIHLIQQVLGDEFESLIREKKYVDITGKVVASYKPNNPVTELLRRRMQQITTQYGECHRPNLKAPCPTINGCFRCKHWRTSTDDLPHLKDDLKRIEEELQIAIRMGMVRQQRGLEDDRNSILSSIRGLKGIND